MLEDSPTAVLTPWTLGRGRLPGKEEIKAITALTPNAFVSSPDATSRSRKRQVSVQAFLRANNPRVSSLSVPSGFVRLRKRGTQDWSVELFGSACRLGELVRRRRTATSA